MEHLEDLETSLIVDPEDAPQEGDELNDNKEWKKIRSKKKTKPYLQLATLLFLADWGKLVFILFS
jgi:hypothetical protein